MSLPYITNLSTPIVQGSTSVYLPTVEACWDFGIARNAPLAPFIGSLLPYNFLRGAQFDTKVFKLFEVAQAAGILGGNNINVRNEVILTPLHYQRNDELEQGTTTTSVKTTPTGETIIDFVDNPPTNSKGSLSAIGDSIYIALDGDSDLAFKITNEWKAGEDVIVQALSGIANVGKNITEAYRSAVGVGGNKDSIAGVPFTQARYSGSDYGTLTINFTLFTRNNYVRDIFLPLIFLQSFCVPKKYAFEKDYKMGIAKTVAQLAVSTSNYLTTLTGLDQISAQTAANLEGIAGQMLKYYRAVAPPDTFKIQHSSGLFFMKEGAITEFTFKPDGPWIRTEYDGLFGYTMPDPVVGTALDRLIQDVYVKFISHPNHCYPTRVKCSMTLKETAFLTLTDFIERDIGSLTGNVQTALNQLTVTNVSTAALIAGGIAQNVGAIVPNTVGAGEILSGGRWVPPGETLSGIPGFI